MNRAIPMLLVACTGSHVATEPDAAPPPIDAPDPFAAAPTCTTGAHWKLGDQRSPLMHPGVACIACHKSLFDAPPLTAAGTVYATGHEPDNCNGATGITIELTDSTGVTLTLTTNDAGNFYFDTTISFPIHARLIANGATRAMMGAVTTADCNTCHTQFGAQGAPGRLVTPE
jgi:hypothetical protein